MNRGKLYIVGTPIGNLDDISPRCAETLKAVDFIAAEDTRNSMKLLNRLNIKKEMLSYFEHNKVQRGEMIVERIEKGENCALITDAGMPAVSDPGEDIVRLCHERSVEVIVIPGPCAAVCALAMSGLPSARFVFEGFLPASGKERRERIEALKDESRTIIFYEAPHRLSKTLLDLYESFGERRVSVVKEITKIYEKVVYTTLSQAMQLYAQEDLKGEFVIVLDGAQPALKEVSDTQIIEMLKDFSAKGFSRADAVKETSNALKVAKNAVYRLQNSISD